MHRPIKWVVSIDEVFLTTNFEAHDRRKYDRTAAIGRSVLLESEGYSGFCLLQDLSPAGMMAITNTHFLPSEAVSVQFIPGHVATGKVIWSRDGKVGIAFVQRMDSTKDPRALGSLYVESQFNRFPRVQLESAAKATVGEASFSVIIQDVSQFGARLRMPFVEPGTALTVHLPGELLRQGIVRWSQKQVSGLKFDRPLAFEKLAGLALNCLMENPNG